MTNLRRKGFRRSIEAGWFIRKEAKSQVNRPATRLKHPARRLISQNKLESPPDNGQMATAGKETKWEKFDARI
jgi:hypothetical protein